MVTRFVNKTFAYKITTAITTTQTSAHVRQQQEPNKNKTTTDNKLSKIVVKIWENEHFKCVRCNNMQNIIGSVC